MFYDCMYRVWEGLIFFLEWKEWNCLIEIFGDDSIVLKRWLFFFGVCSRYVIREIFGDCFVVIVVDFVVWGLYVVDCFFFVYIV